MKKIIPILVGIFLIIGGGIWFLNRGNNESTETQKSGIESALADHIADRVLGNPSAPVTLVEYASLTCPHCDNFHSNVYPSIKEEFIDTGKAKLIYREVYFDGPGLLAASLARCVAPEQYFPMIKTLFDQDDDWLRAQETIQGVRDELTRIGTLAGLGRDDINACFDDREKQNDMIAQSETNMKADGITGTPTVFVNGTIVKDWQLDNLRAIIREELGE